MIAPKRTMPIHQQALIITACLILALVLGGAFLQLVSPVPVLTEKPVKTSTNNYNGVPIIKASNEETSMISIISRGGPIKPIRSFQKQFDTPEILSQVSTDPAVPVRLYLEDKEVELPLDGTPVQVYNIRIKYLGSENPELVGLMATGPLAKPQ